MLNLAFGWIWITMGFLSGAMLGMGFHREQFMGGYDSWQRRLARLGHIAFFGTGFLNLAYAWTRFMASPSAVQVGSAWWWASWSLLVGAIAMPTCCLICMRWKKAKPVFALPVVSLTAGGVLMAWILIGMSMNGGG